MTFDELTWQIINDSIQQWLHTLILERRSHEHGHKLARHSLPSNGLLKLLLRRLLLHQKQFPDLVIDIRQLFNQLQPLFFHQSLHILGHLSLLDLLSLLPIKGVRLIQNQIHHSSMFILQPNGKLHRTRIQFELVPQIVNDLPGIGPLPI